jgi:predicted anti-sigma-YlaC factor YlaD
MPRAPFSMLRACFWLLACVIMFEMALTLFAGVGCFWLIMIGRYEMGACQNVTSQVREVFAELLAAVLALLLAARGSSEPPPPPPSDNEPTDSP